MKLFNEMRENEENPKPSNLEKWQNFGLLEKINASSAIKLCLASDRINNKWPQNFDLETTRGFQFLRKPFFSTLGRNFDTIWLKMAKLKKVALSAAAAPGRAGPEMRSIYQCRDQFEIKSKFHPLNFSPFWGTTHFRAWTLWHPLRNCVKMM